MWAEDTGEGIDITWGVSIYMCVDPGVEKARMAENGGSLQPLRGVGYGSAGRVRWSQPQAIRTGVFIFVSFGDVFINGFFKVQF